MSHVLHTVLHKMMEGAYRVFPISPIWGMAILIKKQGSQCLVLSSKPERHPCWVNRLPTEL